MKTKETFKCAYCGKKRIKKKVNHTYCSDSCREKMVHKKQHLNLIDAKALANDILQGKRSRMSLSRMGLSTSDKHKVDNFIKSICYGNI